MICKITEYFHSKINDAFMSHITWAIRLQTHNFQRKAGFKIKRFNPFSSYCKGNVLIFITKPKSQQNSLLQERPNLYYIFPKYLITSCLKKVYWTNTADVQICTCKLYLTTDYLWLITLFYGSAQVVLKKQNMLNFKHVQFFFFRNMCDKLT
jgi:hypothetical protein